MKCPICRSFSTYIYFSLRCNNLSAARCRDCSHIFIVNSPINDSNIASFYTMTDFKGKRKTQGIDYSDYYRECFNDYEKFINKSIVLGQFKKKLAFLNSWFPHKGKILDVGCATGFFVDMAQKDGWEAKGVEISPDLAEYARAHFPVDVQVADITKDNVGGGPFQVITLFDVIEHVSDPHATIDSCRRHLADKGMLFIRTPSEDGFLRAVAKTLYAVSARKYESPMVWFYSFEHLHSFSLKTIQFLLSRHGFSIIKYYGEEESVGRLNIPFPVKIAIKGANIVSSLLGREHKITVIARKTNVACSRANKGKGAI